MHMKQAALLGMLLIVGCADLESPEPLPGGSRDEVSPDDTLTPEGARDRSARAFVVPPATQAARYTPPPGCDNGAFCAYEGSSFTGRLLLERQGEWTGSVSNVQSVWNNGVRDPQQDHIQLDYYWQDDGTFGSICLHYNPGPGTFAIDWFPQGVRIVRVHWRGECPE